MVSTWLYNHVLLKWSAISYVQMIMSVCFSSCVFHPVRLAAFQLNYKNELTGFSVVLLVVVVEVAVVVWGW